MCRLSRDTTKKDASQLRVLGAIPLLLRAVTEAKLGETRARAALALTSLAADEVGGYGIIKCVIYTAYNSSTPQATSEGGCACACSCRLVAVLVSR